MIATMPSVEAMARGFSFGGIVSAGNGAQTTTCTPLMRTMDSCTKLQSATVHMILRHSGVQFFWIGTSKMAPALRCFVHFDLQMCFAPQRRAIFGHRNFKKCSDTVSFFSIFTSKCAFRHSGVLPPHLPL